MTVVAAPPPGPIADAPGHFAHTDWCEDSILGLSLPVPSGSYLNGAASASGATPVALGNPCPVVNDSATAQLLVLVLATHRLSTLTGSPGYCEIVSTGATVLTAGSAGEYDYLIVSAFGGTQHRTFQRLVSLNPGTTNLQLQIHMNGSGSMSSNFGRLIAVPVGRA